jgi:hypothetical protein
MKLSPGQSYAYKSRKMSDYVIVKAVEIFEKKSRIEVIDHRGNNKGFPFFEKLVLNEDLFELSLVSQSKFGVLKEHLP